MLLLVFFANVDVLPIDGEPIDFLAPGILALAVLSTALVNLAIGTGFEREYGVLKRLGATPLGRPRLLAAKTLADPRRRGRADRGALARGPRARLGSGAAARRSSPPSSSARSPAPGSACAWPGTLKALVTLAAANGLYLVLLLLSGMVIPLDELPGPGRERSPGPPERRPGATRSAARSPTGASVPGLGVGGAGGLGRRQPAPRHPPLPLGVREPARPLQRQVGQEHLDGPTRQVRPHVLRGRRRGARRSTRRSRRSPP